jgi:hypothetical protein
MSQNEYIQLLGQSVHATIANEVSEAGVFGIMTDTIPVVTHKDQLAVVVCFVDKDGNSKERLTQVK